MGETEKEITFNGIKEKNDISKFVVFLTKKKCIALIYKPEKPSS